MATSPQIRLRCHSIHKTPKGFLRAAWTEQGLYKIEWSSEASKDSSIRSSLDLSAPFLDATDDKEIADFTERLEEYFCGNCNTLSAVRADPSQWTPFYTLIYRECRNIPAGKTLSYGALASLAGSPRAARAVGHAMATNRIPLVIPCHRVLGAGGKLGGYSGPGGLNTKKWLLAHEQRSEQSFQMVTT